MRLSSLLVPAALIVHLAPALAQEGAPIDLRSGGEPVDAAVLAAAELTGAPVYGPTGERLGAVGTLVLDPQGKVEAVILDVGGVLGLGTKHVALPIDQLSIRRETEGGAVRIQSSATGADLEAMPEFL